MMRCPERAKTPSQGEERAALVDRLETLGRPGAARRQAALLGRLALTLSAASCGQAVEDEVENTEALATLTFNNGFETGTLSPFLTNLSGGTVTPVTSPVASGRYAAKFDLRRSSVDSLADNHFRAELHLPRNGPGNFAFGKEYWLGIDYMYENWDTDPSAEVTPLDLHRAPSSWAPECGGEKSAFNVSPFVMMSQNGIAKFITYGGKTMWSGPIEKHRWLKLVIHFKITHTSDGYIEAWKDGVKLGRTNGALTSALDDCGQPWNPPYLNVQLYKWDWSSKQITNRSTTKVRTMYVDNVRIAEGSDGYSLVSGSSIPKGGGDAGVDAGTDAGVDGGVAEPPSNRGMVARYRLDESTGTVARDSSENGNTATLVNGVLHVSGKLGNAVGLDGVNDYLQAPASASLNLTGNELSLAAWVNFRNTGGPQVFIAKPSSATSHASPYLSYSLHGLYASSTTLTPRFYLTLEGRPRHVASSVGISPGWHHIAGVYDGADMRIYVDGVLRGTLATSGNVTSYSTPLRLGTTGGFSEHLKGGLDDVRIYSRALSPAEVAALATM